MSRYKTIPGMKNSVINSLFEGSIDMHVHVAPDPYWDRRVNTLEVARTCSDSGMRAFVAKSFYYPTTTECAIVNQVVEGCEAIPSITISYTGTGGLEHAPETVKAHAIMGCRVVWFPVWDAAYMDKMLGRGDGYGICILDEKGQLRPEAIEVLKIVKDYNMVLCKGHMSYEETFALFTAAKEMGITRMVNTHPLSDSWGVFTMDQIRTLADMGVYTEIVLGNLMPRLGAMDPADYIDLVHDLSAERMIMGTDFAQCMDPTPAEGMRYFIGTMLQFGLTAEEVEYMVKTNPAKLLDLD